MIKEKSLEKMSKYFVEKEALDIKRNGTVFFNNYRIAKVFVKDFDVVEEEDSIVIIVPRSAVRRQ